MNTESKSIRLWPGVSLAILQWILWFIMPLFTTGGTATSISVFGGFLCGIGIFVWWAFFSRAKKVERWTSIILMVVSLIVFLQFMDESIKTGLAGIMYFAYAFPVLTMAFVAWVVVSRKMSLKLQRTTMVITVVVACGVWGLFRSEGISGNASAEFVWRWSENSEEKLLTQKGSLFKGKEIDTEAEIKWAGFRGNKRDGIVHNLKIDTDWTTNPPQEVWRKPIGSGCSSFAVKGSVFYTQEQRGESELVTCYDLNTAELIWSHSDSARFWDSHAGAGPRGTPTLKDSLVYTVGATGIVNVLKANDGSLIWSRNAATDLEAKIPGWAYCSSPLVVDSVVVIAISGQLIAYDIRNGKEYWRTEEGGENYSSPQLFTIDGVKQVLFASQYGTHSYLPADGKLLWERKWEMGCIIQPAMTENGDLLISEGYKKGIHRISVSNNDGNWAINEHWMTNKIRPDFNDNVIHKGHLYGYDGFSITCIDLNDGSKKWKGGRYGGQMILLAEQDLLVVLSEKGEIALIEAKPDMLTELAKIPAIEGKTWNHHIIVDDMLIVRNTQEMAAFRLKEI